MCEVLRSALPHASLHAQLLAMLQTIDEKLTSAGIPYWVTGGTLLGAMRHKGFIPHDDDIDIELYESDLPLAMEALGSIGRSFRSLGEWPGSDVPMGRFFFWGYDGRFASSIDVFLRKATFSEHAEFPSYSETFPLQRVPFHNIAVLAPCNPQSFLSRCYGITWRDEAVIWGHTSRGRIHVCAPLSEYLLAVDAAGYEKPAAMPTSTESLACVNLESNGDLQESLWQSLGWASPWPVHCNGTDDADTSVLEMLGYQSTHIQVGKRLALQLSETILMQLRNETNAFLELDENQDEIGNFRTVHAIGNAEELRTVEQALAGLELQYRSRPGLIPEIGSFACVKSN